MNKKQLVVAWVMGILYSALFIQGVFGWNALVCLEKNIYCAMIPITIIGGLFILSFNDKKWLNINRKQFVIIWIIGISVSLILLNVLYSNKISYTDEIEEAFWGIIVPIFIIGSLLIYTLRDRAN